VFTLDLRELYDSTAKLGKLDEYLASVETMPLNGRDVVITGNAPVWLYLKVAHALHGRAKRLYYETPALKDVGRIIIFNHDPF